MKRILSLLLLVIFLTLGGCSETNKDGTVKVKKKFYTFAVNPSTSSMYPYWVAVGKSVQENYPEFQVTVSESQGALDIINRIRSGEAILGNGTTASDYRNYYGKGKLEGHPNKSARSLWYYSVSPMTILVSKDSGIKSLNDLNGVKYHLGGTGTTGASIASDIFSLLGINVQPFESSQSDAVTAYGARQIKGTVKFATKGASSYVLQLNASSPVNILGFTKEQVDKIIKKYPYLTPYTIPGGTYKGIDNDILTIAFMQGVTTTTKLTQEEGYKIIKSATEEGLDGIISAFPAAKGVKFLDLALKSPIPLHAGAVQFMLEKGIKVPKNLIPEEYKEIK